MSVIGELNSDGTVKTEADECALTGRPVLGRHSIMQQISGTPYYFRYLSDFQRSLTPEVMASIVALVPNEQIASPLAGKARKKTEAKSEAENE